MIELYKGSFAEALVQIKRINRSYFNNELTQEEYELLIKPYYNILEKRKQEILNNKK